MSPPTGKPYECGHRWTLRFYLFQLPTQTSCKRRYRNQWLE
jgi:hypothetical protein